MSLLLGLDIGTSSAKAVLFDPETSQILATAGREYPIQKPAPDRAEQDPDDWWRASLEAARQVFAQAGRSDVSAIGLSGQMHGVTLLTQEGRPVAPSIIWADQRSAIECEELIEAVGVEKHTSIAGTLPAAGFTGPTLLWLKKYQPELLSQAFRLVMPKDYVRLRLTGGSGSDSATDISDAAGTGMFDVARRLWSNEILDAAGLPEALMPPVLDSMAVAGHLSAQAAEEMGLTAGIPLVTGSADQPAQALGNGLISPGRASVTTGSGGQVFTPLESNTNHRVPTDPRLHVFNHAVPGMWYILGATLSAGLSLRWLRNLVGLERDPDAYPILSAEAAEVPVGADGLLFLPYLSGERTPHMDPLARGTFVGLSYHHQRGHLARAVMEGVAFSLRQALEISLELGGPVESVVVAGGASQSDVWRQIHADVFGLPLQQSLLTELSGVGAALLGGIGTGVYASARDACDQVVRYGPITEPDHRRRKRYNDLYKRYLELYPQLRADFHWLASF